MPYKEFKKKLTMSNPLAQTDILGSFDFFTTIVSLDSVDSNQIGAIAEIVSDYDAAFKFKSGELTSDLYKALVKVIPLAVHELTHFLDSTSTIWGLRHLVKLNSAYSSDIALGGTEEDFYRAKEFHDYARSLRLPDYYTVIYREVENNLPWQFDMTIGKKFDGTGHPSDFPIVFSRFKNANNQLLVRSPLSTVSLLEASATSQELWSIASLLGVCEAGFSEVEKRVQEQEFLNFLYEPELTEYSVCAHIVANLQGSKDIFSTFMLTAHILRITLNFPEQAFENIRSNCPIDELLNASKEDAFVLAIYSGLEQRDRGLLFYLLCVALPEESYVNPVAMRNGVEVAVSRLGSTINNLEAQVIEEARNLAEIISQSELQSLKLLGAAGISNLEKIGLENYVLPFSTLELPEMYLGDATSIRLFSHESPILADLDIEECFDELASGHLWVENFSEACI